MTENEVNVLKFFKKNYVLIVNEKILEIKKLHQSRMVTMATWCSIIHVMITFPKNYF